MKKSKLFMLIVTIFVMLIVPRSVFATEVDTDSIMKKISTDGKNAVFKMKKPTTFEEADFTASGYIANILAGDDYYVYGTCNIDDDTCEIVFMSNDYEPEHDDWDYENNEPIHYPEVGWLRSYELTVTYDPPEENKTITNFMNGFNTFDFMDPKTYYVIEDLSLINYYLTSDKSELWNSLAPGRALKYSNINEVTKGSNITYYLEVRAGNQDESLMFESAFGPMSIFYNGYSYGTVEEGVYLRRVIYIPESTADTKEAYIEAAQNRINTYLDDDTLVEVTYGGLLSSLDEFSEDEDYPVENNDGNYYNIKIGKRTYKFYIIKGTEDKLKNPTYLGTDIDSQIEITSSVGTIPLDTSLTVKNVNDNTIKDKISTDNYKSYDISLFSDAQNAKIEKLSNGNFLVKIPIPKELEGKNLIVYYLTSTGKLEEHEVTIDGEYAVFETDHFSVYTVAEHVTTNNPQTFDSIYSYIIILLLSVTGLICISLYSKNKN